MLGLHHVLTRDGGEAQLVSTQSFNQVCDLPSVKVLGGVLVLGWCLEWLLRLDPIDTEHAFLRDPPHYIFELVGRIAAASEHKKQCHNSLYVGLGGSCLEVVSCVAVEKSVVVRRTQT